MSNRRAPDPASLSTEKIIAKIIPELWGMAAEFLQAKKDDIEKLVSLAQERKFEEIAFLAHRIKGAAGSYGMDQLSVLAGHLFNFAEKKDGAKVAGLVAEMRNFVQRVVLERVESEE